MTGKPITIEKNWKLKPQNLELSKQLSQTCNISPIVAQVLINRGIHSAQSIRDFFQDDLQSLPDPSTFKDLDRATERIIKAIQQNERFAIYGDYDVDGVSATSLLTLFFEQIEVTNTCYYIPDRQSEGYGLHPTGIDVLNKDGVSLIITVDCGINAYETVAYANSLGIDTIVTDHHEPPEDLPKAFAIINPKQMDCDFPYDHLSGTGVAFYLIIAVRKRLREIGYFETHSEPNLLRFMDLVALGSIADIMPVIGHNRTFIKHGLTEIHKNPRHGIEALIKVSGIQQKKVSYGSVGFILAPRLNAAGRISHGNTAVKLLTAKDMLSALSYAKILDSDNHRRQKIETEILEDVIKKISEIPSFQSRRTICLTSSTWHPGVLGIVASRIVELHHRPTILLSSGPTLAKGSARSISGVHLYQVLSDLKHLLVTYGGHEYAAGLTVELKYFEQFVEAFETSVSSCLSTDEIRPTLNADMELSFNDIHLDLLNALEKLEPHGPHNPEPVFISNHLEVLEHRILKEKHLKLTVKQHNQVFSAIAFRMANRVDSLTHQIHLAYSPSINEYQGTRKAQLVVKDFKPAL